MPEIKSTFTQGKMNKDLDERLIPNGQYKNALNVQVSTSDDSDIGSVQNILGNTLLNTNSTNSNVVNTGTHEWKCVGSIADEKNDVLYWFITSDNVDAIIEYSKTTDHVIPVLVDRNKDVLRFEEGKMITGINIIDDLLFWTDGTNEPKKINIKNFKDNNNHTTDGFHSDFYVQDDFPIQIQAQADGVGSSSATVYFDDAGSLIGAEGLVVGMELVSINGVDLDPKPTISSISTDDVTLSTAQDWNDEDVFIFDHQ